MYCDVAMLEYDAKAEKLQERRQRRIRIGTMDLKIAAIVIANSLTADAKCDRLFQGTGPTLRRLVNLTSGRESEFRLAATASECASEQ